MAGELDRHTLRQLAEEKAADASLLLEHGRWSNGYYLFGYAIELGLKAAISRAFRAEVIPDRKLVEALHTHRLEDLLGFPG